MATNAYHEPHLIVELQSGCQHAFKRIYEHLYPRIYRFIFAILKDQTHSEEVLQETFVNLWVNKHKLDPQLTLYPYLYLIARRLTIDAFRKANAESKFKERLQWLHTDISHHTDEQVLLRDLQQNIDEGMKRLPPQQRVVFQLSRIEGLSYDEIAKELQLSRNTVRNHLVCALKSMKIHMSKNDITYLFLLFFLYH